MRIIDELTKDGLLRFAKKITFNTQVLLRAVEDKIAVNYEFNIFRKFNSDVSRYLLLTSLPFSFVDVSINLEDLWNLDCRECKTVIYRKTMPTGNLKPEFFIVGDAPGVGNGELSDRFDRVWVYGQSSHLLRKALFKIGIYFNCWFTNLLKCSTPKNRPSTDREVRACSLQLEREISLLQPKKIFLLGGNVQSMFHDFGIPTINVYHPTYFVRRGIGYREYSEHLKEKLK